METNPDDWKSGLSENQLIAASHIGSHARLLAGPGTGKTRTLTRHVLSLILEHDVPPNQILAITFTRMAAFQLREELKLVLEPRRITLPSVSTLHSFALRQLLRNDPIIDAFPSPLFIADDWEERNIIEEDLKALISLSDVREVRDLLNQLSAGFETLSHEEIEEGRRQFPNPRFIGAWQQHRRLYGYTLRAELVYQLKRALEQLPEFDLEQDFRYVLIDEYQDLNACDLAVVSNLTKRGLELFAAGDDDQSIYGFRYADPTGIRDFLDHFQDSTALDLEICYRCDREILEIAEFVANQDLGRIPRNTRPRDGAGDGVVEFHGYVNQYEEATGIVEICNRLIEDGFEPSDILILLRNDRNGKISRPIVETMRESELPIVEALEDKPLDTKSGRMILALLRLLSSRENSLAWRTFLQLDTENSIGNQTLSNITALAIQQNQTFAEALFSIRDNPELIGNRGGLVQTAINSIEQEIETLQANVDNPEYILEALVESYGDEENTEKIRDYVTKVLEGLHEATINDLTMALSTTLDAAEQELSSDSINIMTMHRAKGLSSPAVIIAGAEDQFLPGANEDESLDDERRLLFVSLTRAKNRLYITYCRSRIDDQRYTGRESGNASRRLSRFLEHSPYDVIQH